MDNKTFIALEQKLMITKKRKINSHVYDRMKGYKYDKKRVVLMSSGVLIGMLAVLWLSK